MNNKIINKVFKIELYGGYRLHVIVSDSIKETRNKYNNKIGRVCDDLDSLGGLHSVSEHQLFESFIFLTPKSNYGVVAHEAFHATSRILDVIGLQLTDSSEEAYTYLLGYIVDKCHLVIDLYNK